MISAMFIVWSAVITKDIAGHDDAMACWHNGSAIQISEPKNGQTNNLMLSYGLFGMKHEWQRDEIRSLYPFENNVFCRNKKRLVFLLFIRAFECPDRGADVIK